MALRLSSFLVILAVTAYIFTGRTAILISQNGVQFDSCINGGSPTWEYQIALWAIFIIGVITCWYGLCEDTIGVVVSVLGFIALVAYWNMSWKNMNFSCVGKAQTIGLIATQGIMFSAHLRMALREFIQKNHD